MRNSELRMTNDELNSKSPTLKPQCSAWIEALKQACKHNSQAQVALKIGMSPAVVNQVLKGCYQGNVLNVQRRVEGALLGITVDCPVAGDMPMNCCLDNQSRPFAATNPLRVALYRACKTCEHRQGNIKGGGV